MIARSRWISTVLLISLALVPAAACQTSLGKAFEIKLLPGFAHEPLQGIDSIVGKISSKDGPEIHYDIGAVPKPGAPVFGGSYVNQAQRQPAAERQWLKEQTVGGRTFSIAYTKDQQLLVSSAGTTHGVTFSALAKTPADIADILLIVLTLAEPAER